LVFRLYWFFLWFTALPRKELKKLITLKNACTAVEKALLLDYTLGAAYITKGKIAGKCDWNWVEMKNLAKKGLKLNPNNANGPMLLSNYYMATN
jgi:hypothetical protein